MYEAKDRRAMLRVKVKSLAEEARIIRKEETRNSTAWLKGELMVHRREVVRYAARTSYVAYGLIKGTPLDRIEKPRTERTAAFWKAVRKMVEQYGPLDRKELAALLVRCDN